MPGIAVFSHHCLIEFITTLLTLNLEPRTQNLHLYSYQQRIYQQKKHSGKVDDIYDPSDSVRFINRLHYARSPFIARSISALNLACKLSL